MGVGQETLGCPSWPRIHCVDQVCLELSEIHLPPVLRSEACATTPGLSYFSVVVTRLLAPLDV